MTDTPEPWRTAQLYLDECGNAAEDEMRRLARDLMNEGNAEDAAKLFEAFQALKVLRENVPRSTSHLN
jgi:hypothetical protein